MLQRARLRRRPPAPTSGSSTSDTGEARAARRGRHRGALAGLVARREPDRVRRQPPPGAGHARSLGAVRRRRGDPRGDHDLDARRRAVRRPDLAPGRLRDRRLGGRFPRAAYRTGLWRLAPTGPTRARAAGRTCSRRATSCPIGDEQRRHDRRAVLAWRSAGTPSTRCSRRRSRAATSCGEWPRRRSTGAPDRGAALPLRLGRRAAGPGDAVVAIRSAPTSLPEVHVVDVPAGPPGPAGPGVHARAARPALDDPVNGRDRGRGVASRARRAPVDRATAGTSRAGSCRGAAADSRSSSRSTAARTRCTAGRRCGVAGPRRAGDVRAGGEPARARRGTARRSTGRTSATGATGRWPTSWPAWTRSSRRGPPIPDRLGVTGGSYGGYLTNWIIGRTGRFRAAITARSVADMNMLFLTGDISGGEWASLEFGRKPWDDPAYFHGSRRSGSRPTSGRRSSSSTSERDIRTTIGQAEALFTVLRSLKRPVRLMRVPDETHELTRVGAPVPPCREPGPGPGLVRPLPRPRPAPAAPSATQPRREMKRVHCASRTSIESTIATGGPSADACWRSHWSRRPRIDAFATRPVPNA